MAREKKRSCFGLALVTFILGYVTAYFFDLEQAAAFVQGIGLELSPFITGFHPKNITTRI